MHPSSFRLIAATALTLALGLAIPTPSDAQRNKGDEGTGGAAGYSPPVDMPSMDAPAAPMNAPPLPPLDEGASQGAPPPEPAPPEDGNPEDESSPPSDAGTGADIPD